MIIPDYAACAPLAVSRIRLAIFPGTWRDPEVMRYGGEVLKSQRCGRCFESRCADPGVFVLRATAAAGRLAILARASVVKIRTKRMSDTPYARCTGKGLCQRSVKAICDYGFNQLGVHAINAWVLGNNWSLPRLLENTVLSGH